MAQITIPNQAISVEYAVVVSSTGPFEVPFAFFAEEDIRCLVTDALLVETTLLVTTDFTFTRLDTPIAQEGSGYEGGEITLVAPIGADGNTTIKIFRSTIIDRTNNYPNTGPFSVALLNDELNKHIAIMQELVVGQGGGGGGGAQDLQEVTALGDTTDIGLQAITGAPVQWWSGDDLDNVTVTVDDVILAPARAVKFGVAGTGVLIEAYQFDKPINIDGDLFVGTAGRIGGYRKGDSVSSSIKFDTSPANITYQALGVHKFQGNIEMQAASNIQMRGYRIVQLQFSIIANSLTLDPNLTSAMRVDIEEATANFNVVITAPAAGTGYYYEMQIDFSQGSTDYDAIWPASVKWPGGTPPVITLGNNAIDVVHLWTRDAGVTWHGSFLQAYA